MKQISELIKKAEVARLTSYSPYSSFSVGAALITEDGRIFTGSNIENAAFSPSCCGERVAFYKAISSGERHFKAIAIVGGKSKERPEKICPPCGVCRQVMLEFCSQSDFKIIMAINENNYITKTLKELMPNSFDKSDL